ncbi:MAG: hypothetical protein ACI4EW_05605 [Butyrivibrio sp.]
MNTIKKNVFSTGLIAAFCIGVILLIYGNMEYVKSGRFFDYIKITDRISFFKMSYLLSGAALFLPVLSVLPGTAGICTELNSGFVGFELLRETKKKFIWKTIISNALGGGAGTAISAVPFAIIAGFSKPYTVKLKDAGYMSAESYGWMRTFDTVWGGRLVILVLIMLLFLFGAVWSTYSLIFAGFTGNIFAAMASPFLTCFFIHVVMNQTGLDGYSPINMLGGTCTAINSWVHIAIYQGTALLMFAIAAYISLNCAVRRRL